MFRILSVEGNALPARPGTQAHLTGHFQLMVRLRPKRVTCTQAKFSIHWNHPPHSESSHLFIIEELRDRNLSISFSIYKAMHSIFPPPSARLPHSPPTTQVFNFPPLTKAEASLPAPTTPCPIIIKPASKLIVPGLQLIQPRLRTSTGAVLAVLVVLGGTGTGRGTGQPGTWRTIHAAVQGEYGADAPGTEVWHFICCFRFFLVQSMGYISIGLVSCSC
jgi:hypothetical protein